MNADKMIAKGYKRLADLKLQRSAEFYSPDETKYYRLTREMARVRASLSRFIGWCASNQVHMTATLPKAKTGYGYTRYETLPESIAGQVFRFESDAFFRRHIYATKNGIAENLKDAVADLENR